MMRQDPLLVSVVVPMHNAEKFISATLESILSEKETPIEVIVVNDKSSDRSLDRVLAVDDDRVRVIEGPGRGAAGAMNAGFGDARGAIVMFCDSDDLYSRGRIRSQARWLESHPEYDGVCGIFSTIDSKGKFIAQMQCGDTPADITDELANGKMRTSLCTYAIRSALVRKLGGFREFFDAGYDLDYQLRLCELGRIAYLPENWYFYRIHASSITHTQPSLLREFFEQTALSLQRQRRASGLDDLQKGHPPAKPDFERAVVHTAPQHIQTQLLSVAWGAHRRGRKVAALQTALRALVANPLSVRGWKDVFALVLKSSGKASS